MINDTLVTMFCDGFAFALGSTAMAVLTCLHCLPNGSYPVYLGFGKWISFELGDPDWREQEEEERRGL